MTYVVPNYFIENGYTSLSSFEHFLTLNYINKHKDSKIFARSTMHYMVVLLEGSKELVLNSTKVEVNVGEVLFLSQGNYFMSERLVVDGRYRSFLVFFDDTFISNFIKRYEIKVPNSASPITKIRYRGDKEFSRVVEDMERLINIKSDEKLLALKIEEIFVHSLLKQRGEFLKYLSSTLQNSHDRIGYIITSNIDIIDSVENMLSLTRVTKNSLREYFKMHYNQTPKKWLTTQKLEKASLLLKSSDESISSIATSCGYSSVSWFIQQFKEHFGVTPNNFRQNL